MNFHPKNIILGYVTAHSKGMASSCSEDETNRQPPGGSSAQEKTPPEALGGTETSSEAGDDTGGGGDSGIQIKPTSLVSEKDTIDVIKLAYVLKVINEI